MFTKLQQALDLTEGYDVVIKTRCDLIYNSIDLSNVNDCVIIDKGNVFPNDCVIATTRDNFVKIVDKAIKELYDGDDACLFSLMWYPFLHGIYKIRYSRR
jgi:hypothetical protein